MKVCHLSALILLSALAVSAVLVVRDAPPASASHEIEVWSATLTAQDLTGLSVPGTGCTDVNNPPAAKRCSTRSVLKDNDFTLPSDSSNDDTYIFKSIRYTSGKLVLRFDRPFLPSGMKSLLTLHTRHGSVSQDYPLTAFSRVGFDDKNISTPAKGTVPSQGAVLNLRLTLSPQHAGDLDPTFGIGGKLTTAFNSAASEIYDVAQQADGKIVAVGFAHSGSNKDFALARYNPDGSLDCTFGTGGRVLTNFTVPGSHTVRRQDRRRRVRRKSQSRQRVRRGPLQHRWSAGRRIRRRETQRSGKNRPIRRSD